MIAEEVNGLILGWMMVSDVKVVSVELKTLESRRHSRCLHIHSQGELEVRTFSLRGIKNLVTHSLFHLCKSSEHKYVISVYLNMAPGEENRLLNQVTKKKVITTCQKPPCQRKDRVDLQQSLKSCLGGGGLITLSLKCNLPLTVFLIFFLFICLFLNHTQRCSGHLIHIEGITPDWAHWAICCVVDRVQVSHV